MEKLFFRYAEKNDFLCHTLFFVFFRDLWRAANKSVRGVPIGPWTVGSGVILSASPFQRSRPRRPLSGEMTSVSAASGSSVSIITNVAVLGNLGAVPQLQTWHQLLPTAAHLNDGVIWGMTQRRLRGGRGKMDCRFGTRSGPDRVTSRGELWID